MNKPIGIALMLIGSAILLWAGFMDTRERQDEFDNGKPIIVKESVVKKLEEESDKDKPLNWQPYLGGLLFVGGATILIMSKKDDKEFE